MSETDHKFKKIAFISSPDQAVEQEVGKLIKRYGNCDPRDADAIVALGGDGLMLQSMHRYMHSNLPIYGMNCGSVGFLMNEFEEDHLLERLSKAEINIIHPLRMSVITEDGCNFEALAINDVSLFRETYQAAKIRILVDGNPRMEELICDGVLVASPAGSTAYNLSVRGPILPINSPLLVLTPISPFRPRRWRGAILRNEVAIKFEVLEAKKRPVSAVADHTEFRSVTEVHVQEDTSIDLHMMFDLGHDLDERIISEQFD